MQLASYLGLILCGQVTRAMSHLANSERSPMKVCGFCHPELTLDRHFPGFAIRHGLRCPALFFDEIVFLASLTVPGGGISLTREVRLELPNSMSDAELLAGPTLQVLFSALPASEVALLYSAILQEERILLVSSDIQKVSMCVIAAAALVHPFQLAATVLPIIPATGSFASVLESPVPYLIGSTTESNAPDMVFNLDTATVRCAVNLQALPKSDFLAKRVEKLIEDALNSIEIPPPTIKSFFRSGPNPAHSRFLASADSFTCPSLLRIVPNQKYVFTANLVHAILTVFNAHVLRRVQAVLFPCLVTDLTDHNLPITVLNVDLMLRQFADDDQPFWVTFFRTQLFEMFLNGTLEDFNRQKAPL
jgi:hypothetical protein